VLVASAVAALVVALVAITISFVKVNASLDLAQQHRQRAETALQLALEAADDFTDATGDVRPDLPGSNLKRRRALEAYEMLARTYPLVAGHQKELATVYEYIGRLKYQQGQISEALRSYEQSIRIRQELADKYFSRPDYQNDLAGSQDHLADLLRQARELVHARKLLENAEPHHLAALRADPANLSYCQDYRTNRRLLVLTLVSMGDEPAARALVEQMARLGLESAKDSYEAAIALVQCIPLLPKGDRLSEANGKPEARAYTDRAVQLLRQAVVQGYIEIEKLKDDTLFAPLHSHPDFQKLRKELEANVD
jgi:tetratricopeptide (TPR) repeat protein